MYARLVLLYDVTTLLTKFPEISEVEIGINLLERDSSPLKLERETVVSKEELAGRPSNKRFNSIHEHSPVDVRLPPR
jgi:hypothetical protein